MLSFVLFDDARQSNVFSCSTIHNTDSRKNETVSVNDRSVYKCLNWDRQQIQTSEKLFKDY